MRSRRLSCAGPFSLTLTLMTYVLLAELCQPALGMTVKCYYIAALYLSLTQLLDSVDAAMSVCSGRYMITWPIHTYTQTYMHADIHAHRQMYNHSIHLLQLTLHFTISLSTFLGLLLCNSGGRLIGSICLHSISHCQWLSCHCNRYYWCLIDWSVLCFAYAYLYSLLLLIKLIFMWFQSQLHKQTYSLPL